MNRMPTLLTSIIFSIGSGAALAQEVTLKVSDWLPPAHTTVTEGAKVFMAKATELSKGRIQFQHYPAEQLGKAKDHLIIAQTGVADIVNIGPAYITDKFPLSGVAELPGIYEGACRGSEALASLTKPGGFLHEQEYRPNGVRVLFIAAMGAYRILTNNKPIYNPGDVAGLKIRTAGGPMDLTANLLKATSIRMPGPDVRPSLSRGTLDGVFFPLQSVQSFGLDGALKYMNLDIGVGSFTVAYAISDRAWQRLPSDLQKNLVQAGEYATTAHCEYIDRTEATTIEQLKSKGLTATTTPSSELEELKKGYRQIYSDWAEALNKRGRPGTAVVEAFNKSVGTQ